MHESNFVIVVSLISDCVSICCQKPGVFDDDLVSNQLKHSGVLETIRIRRQGYPVRMPFCVFLYRYRLHKHSDDVLVQEGSSSDVNGSTMSS